VEDSCESGPGVGESNELMSIIIIFGSVLLLLMLIKCGLQRLNNNTAAAHTEDQLHMLKMTSV
jgi:hypothetical protein